MFKMLCDSQMDLPLLVCDVCNEKIGDMWNAKATGTPVDGQTVDVKIHHGACIAPGSVTISLMNFMKLFVVANRVGDVGSNGAEDTAHVSYPTGKGFEV